MHGASISVDCAYYVIDHKYASANPHPCKCFLVKNIYLSPAFDCQSAVFDEGKLINSKACDIEIFLS